MRIRVSPYCWWFVGWSIGRWSVIDISGSWDRQGSGRQWSGRIAVCGLGLAWWMNTKAWEDATHRRALLRVADLCQERGDEKMARVFRALAEEDEPDASGGAA